MTSLSNLFLTKGNERNRDKFCIALFEKAWEQAEKERRIPGAKDIDHHLVHLLQDAIKVEDFRNITRLREAIANWQLASNLQANKRRQLEIIQLVLLTEIFDNQYQELLQAVRVRELAHCCDEFISKKEKKLSGVFATPLSEINLGQIIDCQLKLEVDQYQAVLSMQSVLCAKNTENEQKIFYFSRIFTNCRSTLELSIDSFCMQFIRAVLDLLPNALASHFGFFKPEELKLINHIENINDEMMSYKYI